LLWHTKFQMNVSHAVLVSMSALLTRFRKVISTPSTRNFALTVVHAQKFVLLKQLLSKNSPLNITTLKLAHAGFFCALTQPGELIFRLTNMKINKHILLLLILILSFACKDDGVFETFPYVDYPSQYCILSDENRNQLYNEFDADLKIYFEVDSFGFLDRNWVQSPGSDVFLGTLNDEEEVKATTEDFVLHYNKYFGVPDNAHLQVDRLSGSWVSFGNTLPQENESDRNFWMVTFQNQLYNNIEVYNTTIGVYISPKGVYGSYGNWYPEICIPDQIEVTFDEAKSKLVGQTFDYYDWTGPKEHSVTQDDFYSDDAPEQIIIPHRKGDCIELRLCWKITSKTIWNFYVDVMCGELILNEQTVIF